MRLLRGILGYCIAGMLVMSVWGALVENYGIIGGIVAAIFIIGPMWFMNHYVGLIKQEDDAAFVDMGLGIGITGTMRDAFMNGGSTLKDAIPTLMLVVAGAILAGVVVGLIQKDIAKDDLQAKKYKMQHH